MRSALTKLAAIALLSLAGCASSGTTEPETPLTGASNGWIRTREEYYKRGGWTALDAREQAQADFTNGKTPPVEQPHMVGSRRPVF